MKKQMMDRVAGFFFFMVIFCLFTGHVFAGKEVVYLKNNIHYQDGQKDAKASYANYTDPGAGHEILPVNTPVIIGKWRRGFLITNTENNKQIYFEFNGRNMNMSVEEYLEKITSPAPEPMDHLSDLDTKGIAEGRAYIGMTKNGVRMAMGYPATHRTPSLDANTWIYWTNRFRSVAIEFDDLGTVTSAP